jgi:hypothetical protein
MGLNQLYNIGKMVALGLIVIGLGLFMLNQAFAWYYKAEFLKTPCVLCAELNPDVKECIQNGGQIKTIIKTVYPELNISQFNLTS